MNQHDIYKEILKLINSTINPKVDEFDITVPDILFGDFSSNIAFMLATKLKDSPQNIAQKIAEKINKSPDKTYFGEVTASGGYINFKLLPKYLIENINSIISRRDKYGSSDFVKKQKVVVEYFQNNVAKLPHVGHLRSAVIGDSIARILKFIGFKVITDTHIGDWGTQFGILIWAYKEFGDKEKILADPINELNKLYVEASKKIAENPELKERGKEEFKQLEVGDSENHRLWQWFVEASKLDFDKYQKKLELLEFDYNLGESFYQNKMMPVIKEFKKKNLISVGETGEQYVDLSEYKLGRCILIKSDGATTYHLRDFATYLYRKDNFKFDQNLYIVDNRQAHHFDQLFKVLELAGYKVEGESRQIDFGFMSLPEGPLSTRSGEVIHLEKLISEAKRRALEIIEEKNPDLAQKELVASQIGLAAIKYFDLSHNRKTEIIFDWNKALTFNGNSGPYLQYTYARAMGIIRKSNLTVDDLKMDNDFDFEHESENNLARRAIRFSDVLEAAVKDYYPNLICNYLFELATELNHYYQNVPILSNKNDKFINSRLALILGVAQIIKNSLSLLGISAPEKM